MWIFALKKQNKQNNQQKKKMYVGIDGSSNKPNTTIMHLFLLST